MRLHAFILSAALQIGFNVSAQDTFSILAFDSISGEVGAAGASCVDLTTITGYSNDFLAELFPNAGAIASQAAYLPANQITARNRFTAGESPTQIIAYMQANDAQSNPSTRQYGVVRMDAGYPRAAAFTGTNCMNYKNHIVGPNYTIEGNILLGQLVLDSMEARFKREKGDLACKLMAAMQGAKMIGADSRCAGNGSSSLFAFLKVAQPTDAFGQPSFLISLKTASGAGIEPIDSLQVLFNAQKSCTVSSVGIHEQAVVPTTVLSVYPNPAEHSLNINAGTAKGRLVIRNMTGQVVFEKYMETPFIINTRDWQTGIYHVEFGGRSKKISISGN